MKDDKLCLELDVSTYQLLTCLVDQQTYQDLLTSVTVIDEEVNDWDFTKMLMDHFDSLKPDYLIHQAEKETRKKAAQKVVVAEAAKEES